jgi:hypothetical protein
MSVNVDLKKRKYFQGDGKGHICQLNIHQRTPSKNLPSTPFLLFIVGGGGRKGGTTFCSNNIVNIKKVLVLQYVDHDEFKPPLRPPSLHF